jgi:hypothetical protein
MGNVFSTDNAALRAAMLAKNCSIVSALPWCTKGHEINLMSPLVLGQFPERLNGKSQPEGLRHR